MKNDLLNFLLLYLRTVLLDILISLNYYSIFTIITTNTRNDILALSIFFIDLFILFILKNQYPIPVQAELQTGYDVDLLC